MKRALWTVLLPAALVAVVAACTATAPAQPGDTGAAGPAAPEVIELDVESAPIGADWMMTAPEENPKRGGTLRTAWGMAPTHFDIHQGGGCAGCAMMYNGLVMWNVADGYHTIVPALATEWSV